MSEIEELKSYLERTKSSRKVLAKLGKETHDKSQASIRLFKSKLKSNDIAHVARILHKKRLKLTSIPEREQNPKMIIFRDSSVPNLYLSKDRTLTPISDSSIISRSRKDLLLEIYTPKKAPFKLSPLSSHKSPTRSISSENFKLKSPNSSVKPYFKSGDLEFKQFHRNSFKKKLLPLTIDSKNLERFERKRRLVEIYTSP